MKILLVEDDFDKRDKLKQQLVDHFRGNVEIIEKESLRSAWRALLTSSYDLVLLDMSLPSSDVANEPGGGEPESFAGREILDQMRLRNLHYPVVVVTQYRTFENGTVSLEELVNRFESKYHPFFKGYIYYNSSSEVWRRELNSKLIEVQGGGGQE